MTLRTEELDYRLPPERIACRPAEPRDSARLMVLSRSDPDRLEHRAVRDLPELLRSGDLLVRNRTWVRPARLSARRRDSGGRVEGLYIDQAGSPDAWRAMLKSNGKLREGIVLDFVDAHGQPTGVSATIDERTGDHWTLRIHTGDDRSIESAGDVLDRIGATPLPPYITRRRQDEGLDIDDDDDRDWYRVLDAYEPTGAQGSVAAPTAGLHFTPDLLRRIRDAGVIGADVILHVGMGTFKPIETETVGEHPMHAERFVVPEETLRALSAAASGEGRCIAVGTTTARALESLPHDLGAAHTAHSAETSILIEPGHAWRRTDGLLTNFHLPRSTLLAMVAALLPGGITQLLRCYETAIAENYRFYSYGDAMLILP